MLALTDVNSICISSQSGVKMLQDGSWRKVTKVQCDVQVAEQTTTLQVVKHIRMILCELGLNIWLVDSKMPEGLGFHDVVGDFCGPTNYGSVGLNSAEIKVFSSQGLERKETAAKAKAVTRFQSLQNIDSRFTGLLFVCASIASEGPGAWSEPRLTVDLWTLAAGWSQLGAFGRRVPKVKRNRTLTQILSAVRFYDCDGQKLGLVGDFVKAVGFKKRHTYKRCAVWNARLKKLGHTKVFERIALDVANPGKTPWVGTRSLFRQVWPFL